MPIRHRWRQPVRRPARRSIPIVDFDQPGPEPVGPTDLGGGSNQTGVRLYNERLILSLIRRHGALPKAEVARRTGLSAQTVSVIMQQMETNGLIVRDKPRRGRVGQPSVPFALNPEGAFTLGLKIGRRSSEIVLLNFLGRPTEQLRLTYHYPRPDDVLAFARRGIDELLEAMPRSHRSRIAGLGVAAPFELWNWEEEVGAPPGGLEPWRAFDLPTEIASVCSFQVESCKDATAACAAELVLGDGNRYQDFLYIFIGAFVGGGLVIDGDLYVGRTGYAGALGPMPIVGARGSSGRPQQLIRGASIYVLERKLAAIGEDASVIWRSPDDWGELGAPLEGWVDEVAANLAIAIASSVSVIDIEAVFIDGAFPSDVRTSVVRRTNDHFRSLDTKGLPPVIVVEGTIGQRARAIGAGCLPLIAHFARQQDVLFKGPADGT